jgi:1-acyl-sn-glycerol-3-phosphate acyltransferase
VPGRSDTNIDCPLWKSNRSQRVNVEYSERVNSAGKQGDVLWVPPFGSAVFEAFCRTFFTFYCPLTVEGKHYLPDEPFLLCSNHTSHADSAALMTASGRSFRSFAMLGATDYFVHCRRVHWSVSALMNIIPIDRRPGPKSLGTCLAICRQFLEKTGGSLILYPEGTRSLDGKMQSFKPGVGFFASELGVPVVPAYIEGTHQILPKGCSMPRSHSVTVRFGEPLRFTRIQWGETLRGQRRSTAEHLAQNIRLLGLRCQVQESAAAVSEKR